MPLHRFVAESEALACQKGVEVAHVIPRVQGVELGQIDIVLPEEAADPAARDL